MLATQIRLLCWKNFFCHIVLYGSYLYDQLLTLDTAFSMNHWEIASVSLANLCTRFAIIQADGEGVPFLVPIGNDGLASISAIHLGLRFQLNIASLHIDEEGFDSIFGDVIHTIG
jgi:hypothetical protein